MTVASHNGLTAAVGMVLLLPQRHIAVPCFRQHLHSLLGQGCIFAVLLTPSPLPQGIQRELQGGGWGGGLGRGANKFTGRAQGHAYYMWVNAQASRG